MLKLTAETLLERGWPRCGFILHLKHRMCRMTEPSVCANEKKRRMPPAVPAGSPANQLPASEATRAAGPTSTSATAQGLVHSDPQETNLLPEKRNSLLLPSPSFIFHVELMR